MADPDDSPQRRALAASPRGRCRRCGRASGRTADDARAGFCCAGCAVSALVPRDAEGNFPANAALGSALGIALLGFNQLLLASLVWAMPGVVTRWVTGSLALGVLAAVALLTAQWRCGVDRRWESPIAAALVVGWIAAFQRADVIVGLALTGIYFGWALRGLLRRAVQSGDRV